MTLLRFQRAFSILILSRTCDVTWALACSANAIIVRMPTKRRIFGQPTPSKYACAPRLSAWLFVFCALSYKTLCNG